MSWIKCSERMPEEYDHYLVVVNDHRSEQLQITELLWDSDCNAWFGANWVRCADDIVTHWMPLPELPHD